MKIKSCIGAAYFKFKNNIYVIVPAFCIIFVAYLRLLHDNFNLDILDFRIIYTAGKVFLNTPEDLYNDKYRFYYLPVFAVFLAISFSLMPFTISTYLFYFLMIVLGILFLREFNRILNFMKIETKVIRFIFLMIISCGFPVYFEFYNHHWKFIMGLSFLFVLRRELQYKIQNRERNLKFYLINYNVLAFAIAIFPYFVFFFIIYLFYEVKLSDVFKKKYIKKYALFILVFSIQNIFIFIYPIYFIDISRLFIRINNERDAFPLFYLSEWYWISSDYFIITIIVTTIILAFITVFISFYRNLTIDVKFAYFSLICLYICSFADRTLVFLFPLALLLYIPLINQDYKGIDFIKKNKFLVIGLISALFFVAMPQAKTIFKYFPYLETSIFAIFVYVRWLLILGVFGSCLLILYLKKYKNRFKFINK